MTESNMTQLVTDLAKARDALGAAVQRSAKLELDIDAAVQRTFGERIESTKADEAEAEEAVDLADAALRSAAIEHFEQTESKNPHPAVTVRQSIKLDYDPELARLHCIAHLPAALTLKKSAFDKVATVTRPDFVTFRTEESVTVKTDLSAYLTEGETNG